MKIIADTNTFIAVALNEPEKDKIIRLTEGHELIAPDVLPFEIGNALTAMIKNNTLSKSEVISAWEVIQKIPVDLRNTDIKRFSDGPLKKRATKNRIEEIKKKLVNVKG